MNNPELRKRYEEALERKKNNVGEFDIFKTNEDEYNSSKEVDL